MKSQNICKFISESEHSVWKAVNFIFEQDPSTQETGSVLNNEVAYLISKGQGTFFFDRIPLPVKAGDLVFGFSGETFFGKGRDLEYFYIGFTGQRARDLFQRFGVTALTRSFPGHEGMLPFWRESIARAKEENIDIVSESVLMYAFSRLTGVAEPGNDIVSRMTRYADENFSEPNLSLSFLAEEWGYNPKYLSDSFKKRMDIGFSQYLKTVRIKHAVFLMDHGVEAVKNIAFLCGFQDPLYFSKVFRQTVGTSPSEYVKNNRE